MCLQISSASSRFAEPEKTLNRRSSFDTRERRDCDFALAPSPGAAARFGGATPTASIVSVFTRSSSWFAWVSCFAAAMFCRARYKLWLGDQDSNLDKVLQR